jgi:hypothetical protein
MKESHHMTEAYDHLVGNEYKTKDFSRLEKSYVRNQPNNLGDAHIDEHKLSSRDRVGSNSRIGGIDNDFVG